MDLITSITELSQNILREHSGITPGNINVRIFDLHQAQYCIYKCQFFIRVINIRVLYLCTKLDFVNKDIVPFRLIRNLLFDIFIQFDRIAIPGIVYFIQCNLNNLPFTDTGIQQIILV